MDQRLYGCRGVRRVRSPIDASIFEVGWELLHKEIAEKPA